MERLKELPIFCDRCPTLAFAVLDGAPLCEACLLEQVKIAGPAASRLKIEPLVFAPPKHTHYHAEQCFV